jgi:hypothetical protein
MNSPPSKKRSYNGGLSYPLKRPENAGFLDRFFTPFIGGQKQLFLKPRRRRQNITVLHNRRSRIKLGAVHVLACFYPCFFCETLR